MEARSILPIILFSCLFSAAVCRVRNDFTGYEYCGNKPADVVFLLDSSNSIWAPDFRQQIEFVANVSSMFQIGPKGTRVSVVTYNDHVNLHFNLKLSFPSRFPLTGIPELYGLKLLWG